MALGGLFVLDPVGDVLKIVACGAVALVFVYSTTTCRDAGILKGEYYVLGLFALLGIMVLISADSLITLYLGVELLSLSPLRDGRLRPRVGRGGGVGDQVLRAGRRSPRERCSTACRSSTA